MTEIPKTLEAALDLELAGLKADLLHAISENPRWHFLYGISGQVRIEGWAILDSLAQPPPANEEG